MFVELPSSSLAPGVSPVAVYCRRAGGGVPIVLLHGGWGYEIYPFDRQIAALTPAYTIVAPDRTGYGRSTRLRAQAPDFHQRAAEETLALLDALDLERPFLWGHSDGAVISLRLALMAPDRIAGIILEATHLFRRKPASRPFFEAMMRAPEALGDRVTSVLARDHGDAWRDVIRMNGEAWLRIADEPGALRTADGQPSPDLYGGRLPELRVPALVIHGARDPRTEPGELEALRSQLEARDTEDADAATVAVISEGGHSPHSERAASDEVTQIAREWLAIRTRRTCADD
jgi:3-oxoadipate enol-lactonase